MKYKLREEQLKPIIENLINQQLETMNQESEDWGLGEMYELEILQSVDHITIDRISFGDKIKTYVNMYLEYFIDDMQDVRAELQYRLEKWIPNVEIYINELRKLDGSVIDIYDDYSDR